MSNDIQLSLDISSDLRDSFSAAEFIAMPEHDKAIKALDSFCQQEDYDTASLPFLIIEGQPRSGKTHLVNILADKYQFPIFQSNDVDIDKIDNANSNIIAIEDIDKIENQDNLFHIFNYCLHQKILLLMSVVDFKVFSLPDLVSRLRNVNRVAIQNPDPDLIKILLVKGFAKKQLKIDVKIIDYLSKNLPRSYAQISDAIDKIENTCFVNKKTITMTDIKSIF